MNIEQEKRFDTLCENNGVSGELQEFWLIRLMSATDEECENILMLFENYPGEMGWFMEMQKKKEVVVNDKKAWDALLKEEEDHIDELLTN